jgi:hypothetical protein
MKLDPMDKVMIFTMLGLGLLVWGVFAWGVYWAIFCGACK